MLVYRLESFDGVGPYSYTLCVPSYNYDYEAHPMPYEDSMGTPSKDYYYGFDSMEMFHAWFGPQHIEYILNYNNTKASSKDHYGISVYDVDEKDVILGGKQLAFVKDRAQRQSFAPITSVKINNVMPELVMS